MVLAPNASTQIIWAGCVLVAAVGWWAGIVPGIIWSVLVAIGLLVARRAAQRGGSSSPLSSLPLWQVVLVPVLSVPVGLGLGVLAFIVGPGF